MLIGQFSNYRGCAGSIEYSQEDGCYHGRLLDIVDLITYEASTLDELYSSYKDAVDDYIEIFKEIGRVFDEGCD